MKNEEEIIIGIDPGTRITGYGIIQLKDQVLIPFDYGCIRPPQHYKLSERYLIIFNGIEELLEKYQPTVLVVETQFVSLNVQSALKLGMARMAVTLPAKKRGLNVFGYAPTVVKRAVVGNGRASKHQVQGMVQRILRLASLPEPEDAADALALAICHAHAFAPTRVNHEF